MKRFFQKIAIIIFACLLAFNIAAGNALGAAPCLPHLCCGGPMEMGHHNGMINFAIPIQGCCEDCDDIFCDLLKDPLKDVNAVNPPSAQGLYYPVILGTVMSIGETRLLAAASGPRQSLADFWASPQIPLYLEHLSLII